MRPSVAPHMDVRNQTVAGGRYALGNVNVVEGEPSGAPIAPWKRTIPFATVTMTLRVANGALVQPFDSVTAVYPFVFSANETPSREVKAVALDADADPPRGSMLTLPLELMCRRPFAAKKRSMGM